MSSYYVVMIKPSFRASKTFEATSFVDALLQAVAWWNPRRESCTMAVTDPSAPNAREVRHYRIIHKDIYHCNELGKIDELINSRRDIHQKQEGCCEEIW